MSSPDRERSERRERGVPPPPPPPDHQGPDQNRLGAVNAEWLEKERERIRAREAARIQSQGFGFIATPNMNDIRRLQEQIDEMVKQMAAIEEAQLEWIQVLKHHRHGYRWEPTNNDGLALGRMYRDA